MNDSIINHLFLPHNLPSDADKDFLLKGNHENEHVVLEFMKNYLNALPSTKVTQIRTAFQILGDCINRWSTLQNLQNFSASNLQIAFQQLPLGSFLPLYFHTQNAAILIEIDEHNIQQPMISAWQVALPTEAITSACLPHLSCYPVAKYRLCDRSQLSSSVQYELLVDLRHNTIEYSKSHKASRQVDEIRDVPESHYICQWWIQQFKGVKTENDNEASRAFQKKHRDQIRWKQSLLPFRRSGLWMTIKVVCQTILSKHLGSVGTLVYKVFLTHFLVHMIANRKTSTEVLIHCIRKIVRRLNKIDVLLSTVDLMEISPWIQSMKNEIKITIDRILPKSDWQMSIQMGERKTQQQFSIALLEVHEPKTDQHLCTKFRDYLKTISTGNTMDKLSGFQFSENQPDVKATNYIPSIEVLSNELHYSVSIALILMEIWVECSLDPWLNRPILSSNVKNRFEILLHFFEDYQHAALGHYYAERGHTDPLGYSRYLITSLTIIRAMHQALCRDRRFLRLALHRVDIPDLLKLSTFLAVPTRDDMKRLHSLCSYFTEFSKKQYPDLLENIELMDAFGVFYAGQSATMNENIQKIEDEAARDRSKKIEEVKQAKTRYQSLMNSISCQTCQCTYSYDKYNRRSTHIKCDRCRIYDQAQSIKVDIYECPLPTRRESALAVIFELQMPIEIRSYRDAIWQFLNRPRPNPSHRMYEWLHVPPHASKLGPYYTGPSNCKVKLVSATKSITQTHYSSPSIATTAPEGFLLENSLQAQISPISPGIIENERRALTPQLDHQDYKNLQFTIDTTQFVQNSVIAKLSECPSRLKPKEFVEFGSFRSGHRLQWWNLLAILEMDSLPITEESVAILLTHSLLQCGPLTEESAAFPNRWCSESHAQVLDDHFVDELISRLDHRLDDCESNWQHEIVLVVITMVVMRVFTVCNSTRQSRAASLAIKCRRIGEKWLDLITTCIQKTSSSAYDDMTKLRLKMVTTGISCLLTFSTHTDRIHRLLSSREHFVSLLKAATTVHDNIILNKNQTGQYMMSTFLNNMMRWREWILVMIQPTVADLLERTSYQGLNDFAALYWAVIRSKGSMNGKWKKRREDPFVGWYDCEYENRLISINCITGAFLVDQMTIGFLPETITSNDLYVRVFGQHIFEVQAAEAPHTYITKNAYHNGRALYEFSLHIETRHVIIYERPIQTTDVLLLIPHTCFADELPDTFVSSHSHWWNPTNKTLEFRPVRFEDDRFLDEKLYILCMDQGFVTTNEPNNRQVLINQSSSFFKTFFLRYFMRLDEKPYVYMMRETTPETDTIIHIHLSRLGIAFAYNTRTDTIISREYSDMCIAQSQWLDTLTGLRSGLLLVPTDDQKRGNYQCRKLIVSYGQINAERASDADHQTVSIRRLASPTELLRHYFVFNLNDRLRILQSTDSPTGWLYLALLHAMTSHPLPDEYIGLTGMERAFQLLHSAACWSDQPYDTLSLDILQQIAAISPRVSYYPQHLTCMVKIDWNSNSLYYSMQHFGYYLIAKKLIDTSHKLSFMYPSLAKNKMPKIFEGKMYNETLLKKLYWDYRDSYNPTARLSADIESGIVCVSSPSTYHSAPEYCTHTTDYPVVYLANDLYRSGDVILEDCSNKYWLPLSQWLLHESQLKKIWVGLLKMAHCYKTDTPESKAANIGRFELLLDFLHYISGRCQMKPFYLQMLKTALRAPSISMSSTTFPPFIHYKDIEEITFEKRPIQRVISLSEPQQEEVIEDVDRCWRACREYKDSEDLLSSYAVTEINQLFASWRQNKTLRCFLETVQSQISSVPIEQFNLKVSYVPQQFRRELLRNHHQVTLLSSQKSIDSILLQSAEKKFHQISPDSLHNSKKSVSKMNRRREFPRQIFPSLSSDKSGLKEISNYFHNQLASSWNQLLQEEQLGREYPSVEEIALMLNDLREQSIQSWKELVELIVLPNEQLFASGLSTRFIPTVAIKNLLADECSLNFNTDQRTVMGATMVMWVEEQQLERALHFAIHGRNEDFQREIIHVPHTNWVPSHHIPWLILELEMNITIRAIQVKVAQHMMQPNMATTDTSVKNIVMQMNMGEGKTSVILPMLAVSLSTSLESLVRITVLKSLLPTNYQSLRYKLGGLLNRRIFPFACRRDLNFSEAQISQIFSRLSQGLNNSDVVLVSPEDVLSFDLLTIDKCRRNEFGVGRSMLKIQRWLKAYIRDVLDESDDILHVKYQLIYTVGGQQQVDAGEERWKTIQSILELVKKHAQDISKNYPQDVCYQESKRRSAFPQFRLQSKNPYPSFCEMIAHDWLNEKSYRQADRQLILSFVLETNSSVLELKDRFPDHTIQLLLVLRGLLSSEVLFVAFKKRYRVNYGINQNRIFNRLMAVPFRAKDVAADRTEFGHPDVALVLTHLSYYYSGLNDEQLTQCFDRLDETEGDPASIYDRWILYEKENDIPASIKHWKGVNLKDYQQRTTLLFPTFRYNMLMINYFLNHYVFPREAKQFPHKLVASAWDLSSSLGKSKIISGFSGTNDTRLLLPIYIRQDDLPELEKTDAIVLSNLLQPENGSYQPLPINATSEEILNRVIRNSESINVILDVGALFIDGSNQDIAIKWLNLSDRSKIDYVVYFDCDIAVARDRKSYSLRFEISPASERLDRCLFYLDEIHTRGTDFKFPRDFRAALTLGNGLTKDRFVQAAMRMRQLGTAHSLTFWSSHEVHQQILALTAYSRRQKTINETVNLIDILRWVYKNTIESTWEGLNH